MMPAGPEYSSRAGIFKMRRAHFRMAAGLFKSFAPGDVVAAHGVGRTVKQMDEKLLTALLGWVSEFRAGSRVQGEADGREVADPIKLRIPMGLEYSR